MITETEFEQNLVRFIKDQKLFSEEDVVLLAVSGGIDSVVLAKSLHLIGFKFAVAHCNFQLRSSESDGDEEFVKNLASELKVPFFSIRFETLAFAKKSGISIQMAARDLRYEWFEKIRNENGFHSIATAHHENDLLETVLLNLVRGTGLAGFHGILPINGYIKRPLLFAKREEIENYASQKKLVWREDKSNASNKYARNLIRNEVVPLLKKINPSLENTIQQTTEKIILAENQLKSTIQNKRKKHLVWNGKTGQMNILNIYSEENPLYVLSCILEEFGFDLAASKQILLTSEKTSGKIFYSTTHTLVRDRDCWLIKKNETIQYKPIRVTKSSREIELLNDCLLKIELLNGSAEQIDSLKKQDCFFFDFDKLPFPLTIRKWELGDIFQPFGMLGSKKVSDLLVDSKLNLFEKRNVCVLIGNGEIIAVIGLRTSNKYTIDENTTQIWKASLCDTTVG